LEQKKVAVVETTSVIVIIKLAAAVCGCLDVYCLSGDV
jgi:hypothetical protein